jgi:hypothetical protein
MANVCQRENPMISVIKFDVLRNKFGTEIAQGADKVIYAVRSNVFGNE